MKFPTLNGHISKIKKARKLSLGHLEVIAGTTTWESKSLATALYLEIFGFVVFRRSSLWQNRASEIFWKNRGGSSWSQNRWGKCILILENKNIDDLSKIIVNGTDSWPNWIFVWDGVHWVSQKSGSTKIEKSEKKNFRLKKNFSRKKNFSLKSSEIIQKWCKLLRNHGGSSVGQSDGPLNNFEPGPKSENSRIFKKNSFFSNAHNFFFHRWFFLKVNWWTIYVPNSRPSASRSS